MSEIYKNKDTPKELPPSIDGNPPVGHEHPSDWFGRFAKDGSLERFHWIDGAWKPYFPYPYWH